MGVVGFEAKTGLLTQFVTSFLHKEGINFTFKLEDIHTIQISNISYHHQPIASKVTITLRYLPLLQGILYINKLQIYNLHLNALTTVKPSKSGKPSLLPIQPFIKEAYISASYHPYFVKAYLKNLSLHQGDITKLYLQSPYGKAIASGTMIDKKIHLKGTIYPKNLPLTLKRGYFSTTITSKKVDFLISSKEALYKQITIQNIITKGAYDYKKLHLKSHFIASLQKTKATIAAQLRYDKNLSYNVEANITNKTYPIPIKPEFYKSFYLQANGIDKKAKLNITNSHCHISAIIDNNYFTIKSSPIKAIDLNETLPEDMRLSLQAKGDLKSQKVTIYSNYFEAIINKEKTIKAKIEFTKPYKNLNLAALSPLIIDYDFTKLHFSSPLGKGEITKELQGKITIAGAKIGIKKRDDTLLLHLNAPSLKTTITKINKLYSLKAPKKDLNLLARAAIYLHKKRASATIKAKAKEIDSLFSYFESSINATPTKITIPYYALVLKNRGFYATKPSIIQKVGNKYQFTLWIEDSIKIVGKADPKTKSAQGSIKATNYHYSSIEGEIQGDINLHFIAQPNFVDLQGKITLLQGVITYKPKKIRTVEDKDIIVIDAIEEKKENFFQKYATLYIKIDAKRPILYKIPELYALLRPDLLIYKELQKPLQLLGTIKIIRGRYQVEESAFDISPSTLSFYGPLVNPLLELNLKTIKNNYTIYINVAGDLENPILHFDSDPPLQESEILSILAFGTSSNSLIGSAIGGSKLGAMLSNLFIKDLIATFGIRLDTLSLITSSNRFGVEIGKRLSDKITIIYKNDEISTLIIRYRFNEHIESDFIFGPNKSGAHLFYRQTK